MWLHTFEHELAVRSNESPRLLQADHALASPQPLSIVTLLLRSSALHPVP